MSDDDPYLPVACALHSEYELAIMRGWPLRLSWQEPGGEPQSETMVPQDLVTAAGCEYLILRRNSGKIVQVRLDRISEAVLVSADINQR